MNHTIKQCSAFLSLVRPKQHVKNILVLVPLIFSYSLLDVSKIAHSVGAFVSFCLVSASVYCINDAIDKECDKNHPVKSHRPVASGKILESEAIIFGIILGTLGIGLTFFVSLKLTVVTVTYLLLVTSYSLYLKQIPIIDLVAVATGFVLRIIAGIVAIDAPFSWWIVLSTFFLSLFIISIKRKSEIQIIDQQKIEADRENTNSTPSRKILSEYSTQFLNLFSVVFLVLALVVYILYALIEIHRLLFLITVIPVVYVLLRFKKQSELLSTKIDDPTDVLFYDPALLLGVGIFGTLVVLSLYVFK